MNESFKCRLMTFQSYQQRMRVPALLYTCEHFRINLPKLVSMSQVLRFKGDSKADSTITLKDAWSSEESLGSRGQLEAPS